MSRFDEFIKGGGSLPLRAHFVGRYPLCGEHPRNAPELPLGFGIATQFQQGWNDYE